MDSVKYEVKLFAEDPAGVRPEEFIPIFHRWIQTHNLDELLIDVADYSHVPEGPGVVLICHDAYYATDVGGGRLGLLYSRRRETYPGRENLEGVGERLASVFRCALAACRCLEGEATLAGRLRFRGDEVLLRVNDRLLAPNTEETLEELRPALEAFSRKLYPTGSVRVDRHADPKGLFAVTITASESSDVATLLGRLASDGNGGRGQG